MTAEKKLKISFLAGIVALTVGIHYGWVLTPLFGPSHWIHAVHGRFCYIPIVIAASWFGLRGGLYMATVISALVLPYILTATVADPHELSGELVEIVFYFAIAILTGSLIGRELSIRRKQEQTQLQLERSQKLSMVGRMAASVAHEIKNPLASIKGAVEILKDKATSDSDKDEFAGIVSKEIKRIDRTIGEFLEFARPRETKLEKLNLSDVLRSSVKQAETQATKNKIQIRSDIENDLVINGDAEKIHQVVLNLLLNSIEASESGSNIEVALARNKTDDVGVKLVISDHGKGIEESELEKVFEPFYTTKSSGSGLGLAVVKSIVENHQGKIRLESKLGQGTTVTITLPAWRETP
jgi:two-component system sensor histidine kinase HydH